MPPSRHSIVPRTWAIRIAIGVAVLLIALILILAMMPWGAFKGRAEQALASRVGAPVTIGAIERRGLFSFSPILDVRDIRIAQPDWAGQGALLEVERASLRLPVLPILIGRIEPQPIAVENGRAVLIRAKDGRKNWERGQGEQQSGDGGGLEELIVRNLTVDYRDAVKDRRAQVRVDSNAQGFRANGDGRLGEEDVKIAFQGDPISERSAWPFTATIAGPRTRIELKGAMAAPLNARNMRFDITARGNDLLDIDRVIEAGLFGTQPVAMTGTVERKGAVWKIEKLSGTIGRSRLSNATATVDKSSGRTRIDGTMRLAVLDFEDLANDRGLAIAAAKRAQSGPRIIPATRIDLKNVDDVDGVLQVQVDRLVSRYDDPFRKISGTLTLDQARLTVDPFEVGMVRGTLAGRVVVDQRGGKADPTLTLDLKLDGTTIGTLAGGGEIDATLRGMAKLTGTGETVREAVGRSTGQVALVSGPGRIPSKLASFLGLDVGRGVFADEDAVASLRCLIVRMDVQGGTARMNPLLIDTSRSQSRFSGTINLANEGLALSMMGSPKKDSILRLTKPVPIGGTIKAPQPRVPGEKTNVGGVLKMVGDAIAGDRPPLATDADCKGLAAQAMG
ncbi:MAG: AsmA family protein [Alphaproteobacteria bacterium HGW-Alphaproteobacteria-16]|nr:MAG: AsmA family protein [Alphaproteobacteria bacterium HGW-Alphaproteobacteria-16]